MAGAWHAGLAGRAGADLDAGGIEEVEQGVTLGVGHEQVGVARQPSVDVTGRPAAADRDPEVESDRALDEPVPQGAEPLGLDVTYPHRVVERHREGVDARSVEGATAHLSLLAATVRQRHQRGVAAGEQCAHSHRAPEFVGSHRHQVDATVCEGHREVADGLHRVGVEGHPVRTGHLGEFGDRLHRADLVVGPHDGDQRCLRGRPGKGGGEVIDADVAAPVGFQPRRRGAFGSHEVLDRVQDCMVFDATGDHHAARVVCRDSRPEGPLDGQVVRFRAAAGEDDLRGPGIEGGADPLSGLLDEGTGSSPGGVQRTGVAHLGERRGIRLEGSRGHRRGRRVVEVGAHPSKSRFSPWAARRSRSASRCSSVRAS